MALVAEKDEEEEKALKFVVGGKSTPSSNACEGRSETGKKKKGKLIVENDESSTQDELDNIDEHLAFLAIKFSELKFKRNAASLRPFRSGSQSKPYGLVDRSEFKCFNYNDCYE